MRLREFLICIALMTVLLTTSNAAPSRVFSDAPGYDFGDHAPDPVEPSTNVTLPIAPSPLISEDRVLGSAYYDTLSILSTTNRCSDFFGGPAAAVDVFNKLIGKVEKDRFSEHVAMRMSGPVTNLLNNISKLRYRIFDKVSINTKGPFYRTRFSDWYPLKPRIGTFEPNTKEVRVLILLHELGHLLRGDDGNWLLPNDGDNEDLSKMNSEKIKDVCGDQIKGLRKAEAAAKLRRPKEPAQILSSIALVTQQ